MNPSVVNRKDIMTRFNLVSSPVVPELAPPVEVVAHHDDGTISHKVVERTTELSPSISIKLPSIFTNSVSLGETNYVYYLDQVLNSSEPRFTSSKQIQLCAFKVVHRPRVPPFLLYLLNKDSKTNIMYFPHFWTENEIFKEANVKMNKIYEDYSNGPEYKGYYETDHNIYMFYERHVRTAEDLWGAQRASLHSPALKREEPWWWVTIFEIVNDHKVLNFLVDRTVYSIFFKNPLLISLFNTKSEKLETPYVTYFGGSDNYIAFIAAFGMPKETPTSNLGPYYYFYTYHGAGRRAIWTQKFEGKLVNERNGEVITRDEYGVHKRGGIVRFILFGSKTKYFLNRETDVEDDSSISQELAKNQPFIKSTLKLRDVDGKWAVNHDLAYIGAAFIKSEKYPDRKLSVQWAARDYYQYYPLTYHHVNTAEFSNIKDPEIAKNMPFAYKDYNIE
jgi:hypothetical protein